MSKVSIIIPAFNVENYIEKCIDSVARQTHNDLEIIIVDDGSTDNTRKISDDLARRDSRIKVIHQENLGLGPARNTGINSATGEFVMFVDSDDWIDEEMVANLLSIIETREVDAVFSGYKIVSDGIVQQESPHPYRGKILVGEDEIWNLRRAYFGTYPDSSIVEPVPVAVCFAMYRLSLIKTAGIQFPNLFSEDRFFNTYFCRKARGVAFSDGCFYNYRHDGQTSLTNGFSANKIGQYVDFLKSLAELANEEDLHQEESVLRSLRCAVDSVRTLEMSLVASSESIVTKLRLTKEIVNLSILEQPTEELPVDQLPLQQRLFFYALAHKSSVLALLLALLRNMKES